ncbi:cardiolipin synthase [Aerococcaceae bacterium WGS1372]
MEPEKRNWYERILIIGIAFIIQIVWFFIFMSNIVTFSAYIQAILTLGSILMVLYLVNKDESPAYRMSWIIVISLFPVFGGVLYLLMGNKRPTLWMRRSINHLNDLHAHEMSNVPSAQNFLEEKDRRLAALSNYINTYANMPVYTNTKAKYFKNGESMMLELLEDLRNAKHTIFIEFFIVEYGKMFDDIFEVLKEKAKEGVDVRFIYDDFGSITRLPNNFDEQLAELGIKALKFNPVKPIISMVYNTRDHRKFIIIDSQIGYTGGLNLADEYINEVERFGYWKDNMVRVNGPATWNLTNLFLNMWNAFNYTDESYEPFRLSSLMEETRQLMTTPDLVHESGYVQPFGDSPLDSEPIGENVYREILNIAKDYVYIYTPYLVISYELQTAMQLAAKRGVDVRLMTPGIPDKKLVFRLTRSFYRPLIESGIKIYEYSPGFLHAKTFIADDKVATVGTINLDYRSLYLHFETSTLFYYHPVIEEIKADMLESIEQSRRISLADLKVGFFEQLWDAILRLIAPFV